MSRTGATDSRLHFWNLAERTLEQTVDLDETGMVPLSALAARSGGEEGFVAAALSSTIWRFHRSAGPGRPTR